MRRMSLSRLSCRPMSLVAGVAASVLMPLAAWAQSAVPAALDRVPAEAPVMISMRSVQGFVSNVEAFAKKLPKMGARDPMEGLKELRDLLATPGVNPEGSAAVAVMSIEEGQESDDMAVVIVPIKDYAAFAKHLGGKGEGVEEVKIDGDATFIKSLDGGFAAMSKKKDLVEKFAGKPGNGATIEKMLGANGKLASEGKDAVIIANLQALTPNIKKGFAEAKDGMKQMAEMGGQGADAAKGNILMMEWMETGLTRDGQAGVMGVNLGEKGIKLDLAGQFKDGSEFASYFTGKGKGGPLAGLMPNEAYLFAFAIDSSSAGLKKLVGKMGDIQKQAGPSMFGDMNPMVFMEKADAMGFFMGESPAPIGGLLLNTGMVIRTADAKGLMKSQADMMKAMNGKSQNGITFATTLKEGSDKAGDLSLSEWGMKMQADPNNPAGAGIAQMQAMIFGPQGMGGYMAAVDGGMVMTYSKNKDLVAKMAAASKSGAGLSTDAGVKLVGAELPKDRTMEGFIGIKSILNTVQGFMGMMGGGGNFVVPENIPPVGFGGTTDNGGVRAAMYVPMDVITAFADLGKSMGGGMEEEQMEEEKGQEGDAGAGQPKF